MDTGSPKLYFVHGDHLNRPIKMTDGTKASVLDAVWLPFGGTHSITGTASNNARFPGQWFQLESDLHYNWHRSYDPSTGRYTKADPLGLVDGPSVYSYAANSPQMYVDRDGQYAQLIRIVAGGAIGTLADAGYQFYSNNGRFECIDWGQALSRVVLLAQVLPLLIIGGVPVLAAAACGPGKMAQVLNGTDSRLAGERITVELRTNYGDDELQ